MRSLLATMIVLSWPLALRAADPAVSIRLGPRHGHVTPVREGCARTGGGNIDVAQPSPDTLVITMSGVAVATAHPGKDSVATMQFALEQCFEVVFESSEVKRANLTLEGRVIGLLRSHCKGGGTAEQGPGTAAVTCGLAEVLALVVPPHAVACGENLAVNCSDGPVSVAVVPAKYTLHEMWSITATHPRSLVPCKASSTEFAPDPALDPLWISSKEPFHGAAKKDLGFQITIKVTPDIGANGADKK